MNGLFKYFIMLLLLVLIIVFDIGCYKEVDVRYIEGEGEGDGQFIDTIYDLDTTDIGNIDDSTGIDGDGEISTIDREFIEDVIFQSDYQKEEFGAPPRPSWNDLFRHYPEQEFFKQGRYLLSWSKYPGNKGHNAYKWELWQITFKDPANITTTQSITFEDIKDVSIIFEDTDMKVYTSDQDVVLPNDLLPADIYSNESSQMYNPPVIVVNNNTQTGYFGINHLVNGRSTALGYKVRCFRKVIDTDDNGNPIEKEMYNDSHVLIVRFKDAAFGNAGGGSTDGGGGGQLAIEDELETMDDVRDKLGFSSGQNFIQQPWENIKSSTSPVTSMITKSDWDNILFPNRQSHPDFHDKDGTYYTYENFVEASKYFPKAVV